MTLPGSMLPEPALLLLDEPTAGVDVVARDEIWEILDERRATTLVLISTSYLDEVDACDRLIYLDDGRRARRDPRLSCLVRGRFEAFCPDILKPVSGHRDH